MTAMGILTSAARASQAKKALKIACAFTAICVGATALRLVQAQMHKKDVAQRIQLQTKTLQKLRESLQAEPAAVPKPVPEVDSIAKLHTQFEHAAGATGCTVTEFQATPDRAPYISVFSLDTNVKGWEQVSIHVTLKGSLSATLATVEEIFRSDIPVEPDALEITRQSVMPQGPSVVLLRLDFRALTREGGSS